MKITDFWPWLTRHRMRFFAEGDGGSYGGDAVAETPDWHLDSEYLSDDADASKAFAKYKTPDDQLRAHRDAMKLLGQPYRLPKDYDKLSDDQKAEIQAFNAKVAGVPETAEGYDLEIPEGAVVDEQAVKDFKALAHAKGIAPQTAKELAHFQLAFVDRLNKARDKAIQGMTSNNYKAFLNDDCGGDADLAASRMEMVKRLLQSKCVNKDGEPDPQMWEKFAARTMVGDRMIELVLLRALTDAAQLQIGTGGAPGGTFAGAAAPGAFGYSEMDKKK